MRKYLLLKSDEDGDVTTFLNDADLDELLTNPTEYIGVEGFITEVNDDTNPMDWDEGEALLLKIEVLVPEVVATAFKLDQR